MCPTTIHHPSSCHFLMSIIKKITPSASEVYLNLWEDRWLFRLNVWGSRNRHVLGSTGVCWVRGQVCSFIESGKKKTRDSLTQNHLLGRRGGGPEGWLQVGKEGDRPPCVWFWPEALLVLAAFSLCWVTWGARSPWPSRKPQEWVWRVWWPGTREQWGSCFTWMLGSLAYPDLGGARGILWGPASWEGKGTKCGPVQGRQLPPVPAWLVDRAVGCVLLILPPPFYLADSRYLARIYAPKVVTLLPVSSVRERTIALEDVEYSLTHQNLRPSLTSLLPRNVPICVTEFCWEAGLFCLRKSICFFLILCFLICSTQSLVNVFYFTFFPLNT